jgi:hypothetical protein
MSEKSPKSPENKSILWPLNKVAKFIGDILLSPFKAPEK